MDPGSTLEQFLKKETAAGRVSVDVAATIECLVVAGVELAASILVSDNLDDVMALPWHFQPKPI